MTDNTRTGYFGFLFKIRKYIEWQPTINLFEIQMKKFSEASSIGLLYETVGQKSRDFI